MAALDGNWRKSARSSTNGSCVEVRDLDATIEVRDTKQRGAGPILRFSTQDWLTFTAGIRAS